MPNAPIASVVIPAHNEQAVIARCLSSLAEQPSSERLEVVVVANGCTDRTVQVATTFQSRLPHLKVVDRAAAGKIGALNEGDRVARAFPRIYLDADIELGPGSLAGMINSLSTEQPRVASPAIEFDDHGADRVVRLFYDVFRRLPYVTDGLIGLGVYGLSTSGRARFGSFPDVTADDLFAQRMFAESERLITPGSFIVHTPRRMRDLIAVRTRVAQGNAELASRAAPNDAMRATTRSTMSSLARLVGSRPHLAGAALVYVGVTAVARRRARRPALGWHRDESSRSATTPERRDLGSPPSVDIDGIGLTAWTQDQAVAHVMEALDSGRGGLILTPNVDIMRQLRRPEQQHLAASMDLVVADGMPIVWASRAQGTPLPERVTGADLVWSLSKAAARRARSVYLLGGAPGVAERAAGALRASSPDLQVVGCSAPAVGFQDDPVAFQSVIDDVARASPDIVFVAMGFPKQERVALALADVLPKTWFLGCGGALDMAAGDIARADTRLQGLGVEWVHRLAQEPRRLARRYLVDDIPYALALMARSSARRLTRSRGQRG